MFSFFDKKALMAGEYSLTDVLERMYENQLALEATLMELELQSESQDRLTSAKMLATSN